MPSVARVHHLELTRARVLGLLLYSRVHALRSQTRRAS